MFKTFRHRLLFWFLVFICFSLVVIVNTVVYLNKREAIDKETKNIERAFVQLLKSVEAQQNFFAYDTKNREFFRSGQSGYLGSYAIEMERTLELLKTVQNVPDKELADSIGRLRDRLVHVDTLFHYLTTKVEERGFKDFSLEGAMRHHAHWLEGISLIPAKHILSLRRHEKDYIIRNEKAYVVKFDKLMTLLKGRIAKAFYLGAAERDSILFHLNGYNEKFHQMVQLDSLIGVKDNTGLKAKLDAGILDAEISFSQLVGQTQRWARAEFKRLTWIFMGIAFSLLLVGIFLSWFIAKRITMPLTQLTKHITRFVDSNFTLESEHPMVSSNDEIGSLTQNFSHLKDEVINRLRFFKQKVEERTAELANANERLQRLSEANSRFVPDEFLDNLGKQGIEDVALGDYVERHMTVVFTDIREFTKISESLDPQENFEFINTYLAGVVPIIQKHGGFIDKFIGDSVMALFPDNARAAIQTVFEYEDFLETFNESQRESGRHPIRIGSGIHTGHLILGTIGHSNRLETTVISDAVNTASRIEGLCKYYGAKVIVSEATLRDIGEHTFKYRFLDTVKVKGKSKSTPVYEFISPKDADKLASLEEYNRGIGFVQEKKIGEAAKIFCALAEAYPNDLAVSIIAARCKDFLERKTASWEEITQMRTK